MLGDSHANTLVTGVAAGLLSPTDGLWYWGHLACPFLKGVSDYPGCSAFNAWALQRMREVSPEIPLIVISRWSYYALGGNEGKSAGGSGRPPIHFSKEYDRPDPGFYRSSVRRCWIRSVRRPLPARSMSLSRCLNWLSVFPGYG